MSERSNAVAIPLLNARLVHSTMVDESKAETANLLNELLPERGVLDRKLRVGSKDAPELSLEILWKVSSAGKLNRCSMGVIDYSSRDTNGLPLRHSFTVGEDGGIFHAVRGRFVTEFQESSDQRDWRFTELEKVPLEDQRSILNGYLKDALTFGADIPLNTSSDIGQRSR